MRPIGCFETSVRNCHSARPAVPEGRSSRSVRRLREVFVFVVGHDQTECKTSSNAREIFIAEKEMKRRLIGKYRVIRNDCQGFKNLSYTIHLR